jgi:hypothetical protein
LGRPAFVEREIVAVEAEERAEHRGVEEIDDRVEFVDAIFDRRAGEHEGMATAQPFDRLGGERVPRLDALGFVEHDNVGAQAAVQFGHVGAGLLVVDHREERRPVVGGEPGGARPDDNLARQRCEPADLFLPLRLDRGRGDHQHPPGLSKPVQQGAGGDGLDGFAQAHFVGEKGPFGESEVQHALTLVGKQRHRGLAQGMQARLDFLFVVTAQPQPFRGPPAAVEPRRDILGEPQARNRIEGEISDQPRRAGGIAQQPLRIEGGAQSGRQPLQT